MFSQGQFTNDANATPESIARKRAMIAALMPRFGSAKYVGEGLGQLATGVMIGRQNKKLDASESAGRQSADELFGSLLGSGGSAEPGGFTVMGQPGVGDGGMPMVPPDPNSPHALGADTMAALGKPPIPTGNDAASIKAGLVARGLPDHVADGFVMNMMDESGLNPGINETNPTVPGSRGGFGLYQLTGPRRRAYEAYAAEKGVPLDNVDAQLDFLMMEMQGPEASAASAIMSTKTPGEAGAAIVNEFLRPAEEHRASRSAEYLGGAPQGAPAPAGYNAATPSIPTPDLLAALSNPWLAPEQKAVLQSIYEQQVQAGDPMRQLELQKSQLELAQLQNPTDAPPEDFTARMFTLNALGMDPQSPEGQHYMLTGQLPDTAGGNRPAAFQSLDLQAQAAGFAPGTPEYQEFMRNGGGSGTPAAFTALDLQARAAGFEPGTPEYQEFMGTRGAGLAEGAKVRAGAAAEAEVAAPADIVVADRTLGYIDEVRNHPGKGQGTGFSSYGNWIPGTSGKDFQNRVDQLKSGAFLSAIDEMRGMGSLSNAEGQTATAAITRMDTATSEEEFNAALDDYERIVKLGRDRAEKRIKAPGGEPPATDTDGWTTLPNGVKVRVKQ